jgi:LacI family transcriptional regulator
VAITIHDVARVAGVSPSTVSRVVNSSTVAYPIRPGTRDRVLEAIDTLGYRPNDLARGLLLKKSGLIGILVPDISNPYYPEVSRGIEDVANGRGYKVMFCSTDRDRDKATSYIDALLLKRVDGIVLVGGGDEVELSKETVAGYDTQVVCIGRPSATFPTVRVDNVGAGRMATEHLLGLGHRRVAFVSALSESTTVNERQRGYREALEAGGTSFEPDLVVDGGFTEAGGYAAGKALMSLSEPPTAIFAANDRMAVGAMAAIKDLGLRVPTDVALVGFDDVPVASYLRPALTTVSVSSRELGAQAMKILLDQMDGQSARRRVRVDTRLVIRQSCGAGTEST